MVTGFKSECKSKVTVTPGAGSACKAHAVTGDAFPSALGTVVSCSVASGVIMLSRRLHTRTLFRDRARELL
jgi:hypothetical protein